MSGTSLNGVDEAIIETDGERILRFGPRGLPITFPTTSGAPKPLRGGVVAKP